MSLEDKMKKDDVVVLQYHKDGKFWFRTAAGFEYPAPSVEQRGHAAYLVQDRMLQFVR